MCLGQCGWVGMEKQVMWKLLGQKMEKIVSMILVVVGNEKGVFQLRGGGG